MSSVPSLPLPVVAPAAAPNAQAPLLQDPVSFLLKLLATTPPDTRIAVGLAGVPGSGKTTFAAQLAARVNTALSAPGTACVVLGMDGFHLSKARLEQGVGEHTSIECFLRRGAPFTFDGEGFAAALYNVLHEGGTWPDFDHAIGDPEPNAITIPSNARLLIVEGIYVLLREGKGWCTLPPLLSAASWFLDTPREIANERLATRHMKAWNLTREAALERIALNDGPNGDIVVESGKFATARVLPFEYNI